MQDIAGGLYARALELTDKVLDVKEDCSELQHMRDLLTEQNWSLEKKVEELSIEFQQQCKDLATAQSRVLELEATASTLTEWNSSLEQQCQILTESLRDHSAYAVRNKEDLQGDLLLSTQKCIHLKEELNAIDEENHALRRSLRDTTYIQKRLLQENAILKSKLYDAAMRQGALNVGGGTSEGISSHHANIETPVNYYSHMPMLENISLESKSSISEILSQLKLAQMIKR